SVDRLDSYSFLTLRSSDLSSLDGAVVAPTVPGSTETTIQYVGRAAANQLLESLRDGDVIAITGGKAVSAVVDNLVAERTFDVTRSEEHTSELQSREKLVSC